MKPFLLALLLLPISAFGALPAIPNFNVTNFYYSGQPGQALRLQDNQNLGFLGLTNSGLRVTRPPGATSYVWFAQASIDKIITDVRNFGAKGDGITDDRDAIQAALNTGAKIIRIPDGTYLLKSSLTLSNDLQVLEGSNERGSALLYDPAASGSSLIVGKGSSDLFQVVIRNLAFQCTSNAVQNKIALDMRDVRVSLVDNVSIGPWVSAGTNNVGLQMRGRDNNTVRRLYSDATLPVRISVDPNTAGASDISLDHFTGNDWLLICENPAGPNILIDAGVYTSEVTLSGYQSWNKGLYGIYRRDKTAYRRSEGFYLTGQLRREQSTSTNGWSIYFDMGDILKTGSTNNVLQNFAMFGGFLDLFENGIYMRGVYGATFIGTGFYPFQGATQVDADDTCDQLMFLNCFSQQGGVASFSGLTNVLAFPTVLTTAMPETAQWVRGTNTPNKPFTVSNQKIAGGLGIGTSPPVYGVDVVYPVGTDTNDVTVASLTRFGNNAGVTTPLRVHFPLAQDFGGGKVYTGDLAGELPSIGNNSFSIFKFGANFSTNVATALSNLTYRLQLDGTYGAIVMRSEGKEGTNSDTPVMLWRNVTNFGAAERITYLGFFEHIDASDVRSRPANIGFTRDNAHGWYGKIYFGANNANSPPASDDAISKLLAIDGYANAITPYVPFTSMAVTNAVTFDANATANETRMLLWDVTAGSFRRVSIGAADSGGAGFRVLRIPN